MSQKLNYKELLELEKLNEERRKKASSIIVMTDFEHNPSIFYSPVFVCEQCGNISRVFMHIIGEEHYCRFCGEILTMTRYALSDDEAFLLYYETKNARTFRENIFVEYIRNSPQFTPHSQDMRYVVSNKHLR